MGEMLLDRRSALIGGTSLALTTGLPFAAHATDEPRRGGVLVVQTYSDLKTLNPAMRTSYAIHVFTSKMIEPLVDLGPNNEPVPKLAVSWDSSPDGKTITFKLRDGVKWHDGKPFTSADVQFCAMEMWKKYQNYGTLLHKELQAVDTPDALTAVFRYGQPMPLPLLLRAAPELCYVVPRHVFEGTDLLKNPANLAPIGTGPFRFVSYQPDQQLIVERNPDYWVPGQPYLDRVIVRVIVDAAAAAAALEAGDTQISFFSSVPRTDLARLAQDPHFRVSTKGNEAYTIFNTLGYNTRRKELADVRVRRAIAHSLDLEFYGKEFLLGYGKRAQGPVPTTSSFFVPGAAPAYPFDLQKAEALLDEAGLQARPGWHPVDHAADAQHVGRHPHVCDLHPAIAAEDRDQGGQSGVRFRRLSHPCESRLGFRSRDRHQPVARRSRRRHDDLVPFGRSERNALEQPMGLEIRGTRQGRRRRTD
jgi:peptide/nickel transport system substrate-binding protein